MGQGCKVCVHRMYCPANYWQRRYGLSWAIEDSWFGPDDHNGIQCASWSNNPADRWSGMPNQRDVDEDRWAAEPGALTARG